MARGALAVLKCCWRPKASGWDQALLLDGDGDDHHHADDVRGASWISAAWCNFSFLHSTLISTLAVKKRRQFLPKIIQTVHIYTVLEVKGIFSSFLWWKLSGRNGVRRTSNPGSFARKKTVFAVVPAKIRFGTLICFFANCIFIILPKFLQPKFFRSGSLFCPRLGL